MSLRVQFAHGLQSSPRGNKGRLFAEHFQACIPAMDTSNFAACVQQHDLQLRRVAPQVLVGSSFGGAVVVELLRRGLYRGPTLLLAQASALITPNPSLPTGVRVLLVHASDDPIVPVAGSRALAATGSPQRVELREVDDDHALSRFTRDGRLLAAVRELAAAGAAD